MQQVNQIVDQVKQMLKNHVEIETGQTMIVNLNAFAESSVDFFVYTFTKTTDWVKFHEIKQDILLQIVLNLQMHISIGLIYYAHPLQIGRL